MGLAAYQELRKEGDETIEVLPLRVRIANHHSFEDILDVVVKACSESAQIASIPHETLKSELRERYNLELKSILQVSLGMYSPYSRENQIVPARLHLQANNLNKGLKCELIYNAEESDEGTIARFAGHYRSIVEAIAAFPERPLADMSLLTDAEHRQIAFTWNDTNTAYPQESCLHELFEINVGKYPQASAILFDDQEITYHELNQRGHQRARQVEAHLCLAILI